MTPPPEKRRYDRGDGEIYEPHEEDPIALTRVCPACNAPVGSWCGGVNDIHEERTRDTQARDG